MHKVIVAALVAGAAGAAAWAAVSYFLNIEIGFLAWGIGGLVGFAVQMGVGEAPGSVVYGVLAAVIALGAVAAGKYLAVYVAIESQLSAVRGPVGTDYAISVLADEVVEEFDEAGKPLNYPATRDPERSDRAEDYPADVWAEAVSRYEAKSDDERAEFLAEVESERDANVAMLVDGVRADAFKESFSPFDLLWVFFAVGTAFKMGAAAGTEALPEVDARPPSVG
jgi:hypothetical protein